MKQDRKWMIVLYPDSESYTCDEVLGSLDDVFYEWAFVLHDKDVNDDGSVKKTHYHVVGRTSYPCLPSAIAGKLGVPENHVEYVKKWCSACRYLVHADHPMKFQYDGASVVANFPWLNCLDKTAVQQGSAILDEISCHPHTVSSLMRWSINNGCYSQFVRGFAIWSAILTENKFKK